MNVLVVIEQDAHGRVTVVGVYDSMEWARRVAWERAPWAVIVPAQMYFTPPLDAVTTEREDAPNGRMV